MNAYEETRKLKAFAVKLGASLVGVADLSLYNDVYGFSRTLLEKFPFAISIAVRLSDSIIEGITEDGPTEIYVHHYKVVNALLDEIALRVVNYCQKRGAIALPIPASQILDQNRLLGAISHKAIAVLAGLGWLGKSSLLINEKYGPRIRLVSVLTSLPLIVDKPVENKCGDCTLCAMVCPAKAIKGVSFEGRIPMREEIIDIEACDRRLSKIASNPRYGSKVCGLCIKICPWGRGKLR